MAQTTRRRSSAASDMSFESANPTANYAEASQQVLHSYSDWRARLQGTPLPLVREQTYTNYHSRVARQDLDYWTKLLKGYPPTYFDSRQGLDAGRPSVQEHATRLDDAQLFHKSCASSGINASTLIQAAWALTLGAHLSTRDVCFAYKPPSRDVPLVGPFLKTLYRRVALDDKEPCRRFLRKIHHSYIEAVSHQRCSVSDIDKALGGQVYCNSFLAVDLSGTYKYASHLIEQSAYDIAMVVHVDKDQVSMKTSYRSSRISAATVQNVASSFSEALFGLMVSPMTKLGSISLIRNVGLTPVPDAQIKPRESQFPRSSKPFDMSPLRKAELARVCRLDEDALEDAYPTTALQQGLMTITTRNQDAFTTHDVYKLSDKLDQTRLQEAVDAIAQEYVILRSRLIQASSEDVLQVVVRGPLPWTYFSSLDQYYQHDRSQPMSYAVPLWRFAIVNDAESKSTYLCWTAHHAAYDGWAENLILAALRSAYESSMFETPRHFADFISYLKEQEQAESENYWANQLAGNPPTPFPPLPAGAYTPHVDQRIVHRVGLRIPDHSLVLPTSFLRAAWALTLSQYSDSDDIIFASTLSGRQAPLEGIEAVAGPTITTVPLRIAIDRTSSVAEYLGKMHSDALDMIPHEHLGLQNISRISPDVRKAMILNSYFLVQPSNPEGENPDAKALGLERVAGSGEDFSADAYPLNVQCHLDGDHVIIDSTFDQNVLSRAQMDLMVRQFEHVIASLGHAPPDMKLSDMPMVSEYERQTMLKLNGPYTETLARCVHEVIEERAAEHPDEEAICSFDGVMSYGELNKRADQLASKLVARGVGPEVPVPICMEKGIWVIVTMLAVLKAGGVVVCFTASQPKERLGALIRSLDADLMIADPQHTYLFEGLLLNLLTASEDLFADSTGSSTSEKERPLPLPSNAAFIVFTSGSTGTPKGIVTEHQSICTSSMAHGTAMGIERGQRVLQYSSFTYDVYIQDIFTSLQKGATVCVVSEEERYNDLGSAIRRTSATWADLTSTVAALLDPDSVPTLKTISLGGEPMKPEVASKWEPRPGMQVINVFGPAEASVTSTLSTVAQRNGQASNIGPPCGCWAWVADPANHNLLKPIGSTGELMLHGPILARHYLNDPAKTSAAFLTDLAWMSGLRPESEGQRSERAYATGDLVKMQPDGTLLYVGRADKQVKINGQRVELGEIENTLTSLVVRSDVGISAKTACELISTASTQGRKVLTAFISSEVFSELPVEGSTEVVALTEGLKDTIKEVSEQAKLALPSHMVPSLYLPMRTLPMSASGKLDRKVLKAVPEALSSEVLNCYAPAHAEVTMPETPRQFLLRTIWCSLLKLPESAIGADTNFFAMGADSISAMQLVPKAQAHGLGISVAEIMKYPKLRDMAFAMEEIQVKVSENLEKFALCPPNHILSLTEEASAQCNLGPESVEDIYPSTKLQEGLLALTAIDPNAYVNRLMFKLPESLDLEAFQAAWNKVYQHHSILRSRLFLSTSIERYMQAVVSEDITWLRNSDLAAYIENDEATTFSAGQPLVRFALVSRQQEENFFVLTMHHAAYDGHSVGLLFEDLLNAYQGSPLVNMGDFRPFVSFLENQSQAEQEKYWQDQLGDQSTTTWPLIQEQDSKSAQGTVRRQILTTQAQRVGTRTALLLRAAWILTTSQYANSDDVVMAVTLSGRDMPVPQALEVTGPLLTTVPVRVKYDQSQTVGEFLNQIEAQATGMINFQHFGLQNIMSMQKQRGVPLSLNQLFLVQPVGDDDDGTMNNMGLEPLEATSGNFETYPLNVEVKLGERETTIEAVHDLGYVDSKLMERIMDQFCHMIHVLHGAAGTSRLSDLDIVNEGDDKWITSLNKHIPERTNECVHERVAQHVVKQPQAQAISSFDRDWTYAELDEAADLLANRLRQFGVAPGEMVPLCFDKSSWAILAMYAVLKAGGACTSVSASYPKDRMSLIVQDTKARVVLCSPQHTQIFHDLLSEGLSPEIFGIDDLLIQDCKQDASSPVVSKPTHTDAAFVVYTSGSTGRPKGVIIEHGASRSSANAHGPMFGFDKNSRVAQFAAYTFDVSIQDIFTTLSVGGTVCVLSEEERMSDLAGAINRRNANWMEMTPTVANLLSPLEVPSLKTLSLGGEILTEQALSKWYTNDIRLLNTYGPTECSINSTWAVIDNIKFNVSNIGKPVGCVLWVTAANDHHRLLPVGCVGEMLIEGPILAREYLNDSAKTNAAFVSGMRWLPSDAQSQARRFYKTGDLVRYREDGGVDYLGRKDQQVKLNGLRIELGEIEAQTEKASSSVKSAAVDLVQPRARGTSKALAAFVKFDSLVASKPTRLLELNDDLHATFIAIRGHLETAVPNYMVPSLFFPLSELPMSASGKLDRKMLRSVVENLSEQDLVVYGLDSAPAEQPKDIVTEQSESTVGSSEAASKIIEIASRVLKVQPEKINVRLSWVSSGGDSISAMMFASKCRAEGLNITVATLLKSKSLLDVVKGDSKHVTPAVSATKDIFNRAMPLTPAQKMFFEQLYNPNNMHREVHYNQSWYGKLRRQLSTQTVLGVFQALVNAHPMLRSHFLHDQGVWKQQIPDATSVSFANALKVESLTQLEGVVSNRHATCIDFQKGPIFTADVFELPSGEQYVCMIAHHLVVDVVSWQVIVDDFCSLAAGKASIEKEPILFPVWAELQLEKAQSTQLEPTNTGAPPSKSLDGSFWGIDKPSDLTGRSVVSDIVAINPTATSLLLGPANHAMNTETIDLLLAAISHAFLHTFPERDHLTVFNEGHGRESWSSGIDLTRTVGWFTTIFPVSVQRSFGDDFKSVVRQVKDGRKALSSNGWAYSTSRYLNPKGIAAAKTEGSDVMEVEFNWHGNQQEDTSEDLVVEEVTLDVLPDQGADVPAQVLFDIGALVQDTGELEVQFQYHGTINRQAEIKSWVKAIERSLYGLVDALTTMSTSWTLHDFPLLKTTYSGLDRLQDDVLPSIGALAENNIEDVYPCTPMQDGILLSQIRGPGSYETESTFEVSSADASTAVDASRLSKAWQYLISRHSSMRSIFIDSIGTASAYDQIVLKNYEGPIILCESDTADNAIAEIRKAPAIDYRQLRPPHRLTICEIPGGKLICRIEASHTVTDGFSGDVFEEDLIQAYCNDALTPIGPVYRDFVEHVYKSSTTDKLEYWRSYLQGIEPTVFPRLTSEPVRAATAGNLVKTLSDELSAAARLYCEKTGVTVATLVQTAWAAVLRLYTGSSSVCFGYLASGRDTPIENVEKAIGAYMNMMVCRTDFQDENATVEVVKRVHERSLQSLSYQHLALADIQHELGFTNQTLFNTIMSFQKAGKVDQQDETASLVFDEIGAKDPTEYDIALDVGADDESIEISMDFSSQCLSDQQAARVLASFEQAVHDIIADEALKVANFWPISSNDREELVKWNGQYPAALQSCIHTNFEEQARQHPNTPAIVSFDVDLSYSELNTLADMLASYLYSLGVKSGVIVPLCFPKTTWAAVAQLAVLKAGAACASLNPEHPLPRLSSLIAEVNGPLVLCSDSSAPLFAESTHQVVTINEQLLSSLQISDTVPTQVQPCDTAFVVFTSGSTGKPKGVTLSHSALTTSAQAHGSAMSISPSSRVLQYAAYTYDVSVQDLWTTLQRGGTTCVISEGERLDVDQLISAINSRKANWADLTPTVASLIDPEKVPTLATVSLGGEMVPRAVIETWERAGRRVINGYGPAEASINCACSDAEQRHGDNANIGRPLASWFWVTHPQDTSRLMPIGTVGELLVESPQLSDGYLNDEAKTNAAFIKDPKWAKQVTGAAAPQARRMYRTGDMVKLTEEGTYVIVGRSDRQIKIRGQRVELGEVEYQVQDIAPSNAGVIVDVVETVKDDRKRTEIAAFFDLSTCDGFTHNEENTLLVGLNATLEAQLIKTRDAVSARLPKHMVPSFWVPLCKLPVNASGKTDFKQLRSLLDGISAEARKRFSLTTASKQAPRWPQEKALHKIFCGVFGLSDEEIGVSDSFLGLGGDSIMAMRVVKEARRAGLDVTVPDVLQHPQLDSLARLVRDKSSTRLELEQAYEPLSLVASDAASRAAFVEKHIAPKCALAGEGGSNVLDVHPVTDAQAEAARANLDATRDWLIYFTWTGNSSVNIARLKESLLETMTRFDSLRSVFVEHNGEVLQVVMKHVPDADVQLHFTDRSLRQAMDELQANDMGKPVEWGQPLAQCAIIQHAGQDSQSSELSVVLRMTHAQYDGMSMHVIVDFFQQRYNNIPAIADNEPRLSQGQYTSRVKSEAARLGSFEYWRKLLRGSQNTNVCAYDTHPAERGSSDGEKLIQKLVPMSQLQSARFTLANIVKASWVRVLADVSGNPDVVYGDLTTGRNTWESADQVDGCCYHRVPVRIDVSKHATPAALAQALAAQSAESMPHENLGWTTIAAQCTDWVAGVDDGSLVQHTNMSNEPDEVIELGGVQMRHGVFDQGGMGGNSVSLETEAREDGHFELSLYWKDRLMSQRFAEDVVERMQGYMLALCAED